MTTLFDPVTAGDLHLANRIVMAPLTRNRAPDAIPTPLMAEYYAQRANPDTGAGLIIARAPPSVPRHRVTPTCPACTAPSSWTAGNA